ncbi:uncharacterized protein LOC111345723 [Stylophora pistillata]|uniref:uncharacterized protein LOC111345723 n=1 Tax=Stylophora pistillata TaxID=50429 RepID=UPI000C040330|nr:uncharacterized protein LOC111345723 [Stylophora pistillata]
MQRLERMQSSRAGVQLQNCEEADWQASLDQIGWSMCPRKTTFLRGLWRHDPMPGDNRVGRIETGNCCRAEEPTFINQSSTCLNADWSLLSNRYNVWALCPSGYFMNGLRLDHALPAFLNNIAEAKCCHPQNHPSSYEDCYDEDVTISFDRKGWSECQQEGFYMTGFYKSSCDKLYCIEKFRCCKMKSEPSPTPQNVKGTSISSSSISVTGNEVPSLPSIRGLSSGVENSGKTEPPREPSAAPQNVKGTSISSTSLLITWDEVPSADRNGFILTHTITYRLATESHNASVTVKATEFQKELTGLKEHANYSITVFSTNQIGDGPASKPIFVTTSQHKKDQQTSGVLFQFTWASVGAFAVLVCVVLIVIAMKRIKRKRKGSLVEERNDAYNVSMLEITPDIMNQLRDQSERNPIETQAEVPNSGADEVAVVDNETYMDQMEIDRSWEIPRERLEILETELGGGEFGVVIKGNYLRGDGNKLPVAVKMLRGQIQPKAVSIYELT